MVFFFVPMSQRTPRALGFSILGLITVAFFARLSPIDAEEPPASVQPYGRACLVVEDASTQADSPLVSTSLFDEHATPGPGRRLAVYADASVDAYVVIAALNDTDRRLTNGWRPQFLEMKAWKEQPLPLAPTTWEWTNQTAGFSVYVVFLTRAAAGIDALQNLIAAMQDPKADPTLLDLQAKKLREEIVTSMAGQEPATFHSGAAANAWGGTLRGEPFPWPKLARKAEFQPNERGVLLYHHGR